MKQLLADLEEARAPTKLKLRSYRECVPSGRCSSRPWVPLLPPVPGLEPRNLRDGDVEGRRNTVLLLEGGVRRVSPFHPGTERPRQLPGATAFLALARSIEGSHFPSVLGGGVRFKLVNVVCGLRRVRRGEERTLVGGAGGSRIRVLSLAEFSRTGGVRSLKRFVFLPPRETIFVISSDLY